MLNYIEILTIMRNNIEMYPSPSGMMWQGKPSNVVKSTNDSVFAFFNNPIDVKRSDCIIEIWKKVNKRFLGIAYKTEIKVIGIFRVKTKNK